MLVEFGDDFTGGQLVESNLFFFYGSREINSHCHSNPMTRQAERPARVVTTLLS
jgi:hypothetical protein